MPADAKKISTNPVERSGPTSSAPPTSRLTAPGRAEQETQSDRDCQSRVGSIFDRLVDGLDKFVRNLAHGIDSLLALVLGVGHDAVDAGPGPLPCRVAPIGDVVGDLRREAAEIIPEHLQVFLQVAGSRPGSPAHIAHAFARFTGGVTHVAGNRRGVTHAVTPSMQNCRMLQKT